MALLNKKTAGTAPQPTPQPQQTDLPQIIRDQNTGRISGITAGGRTTLTANINDINAILNHHAPQPAPQGAVEASQIAAQQQQQKAANEIIQTKGPITGPNLNLPPSINTTPDQQAIIPPGQAGEAAAAGLGKVASISGATGAGGVIGGVIGGAGGSVVPGPGTAAGAIGGAVIGGAVANFIEGAIGNLKNNANEGIAAEYSTLPHSARNLRYLTADMNKGITPDLTYKAFKDQLDAVDQSYANLNSESRLFRNKFLGTNTITELKDFKDFYAAGGQRDVLVSRMNEALINPNPALASAELSLLSQDASQ